MPLEDLKHASGVRILKGNRGTVYKSATGEVIFRRAPTTGIDQNLFGVLKATATHLGIVMVVSSIDTGKHATHSRHYSGCAADIAQLAEFGKKPAAVRWPDALADELAHWLRFCGFKPYEGGDWPCCLWGAPHTAGNQTAVDHRDHLHVSISPFIRPTASPEEEASPASPSASSGS